MLASLDSERGIYVRAAIERYIAEAIQDNLQLGLFVKARDGDPDAIALLQMLSDLGIQYAQTFLQELALTQGDPEILADAAQLSSELRKTLAASPSGLAFLNKHNISRDAAELSKNLERVGGIDLDPSLLDLQIKRDGKGVPLPLPQQPIGNMRIEGFLPVIINVVPVNIPMILGLDKDLGGKHESELSYQNTPDPMKPEENILN